MYAWIFIINLNAMFGTSLCWLQLLLQAGSENATKSQATGDRFKEAMFINSSLTHLASVFDAIVRKAPHVPFRNSQLTQFLQDSLSGSAKVLMLLHVSPSAASTEETIRSMSFGKTVRCGPGCLCTASLCLDVS